MLSCASFLPGQWLLRSETLAAMFRFGIGEGAVFLALLLPLAGALSALLMAIAIRCRSVKEAQANATALVLAVSLLPLLTLFNQEGEAPWHLGVPALGADHADGPGAEGRADRAMGAGPAAGGERGCWWRCAWPSWRAACARRR